jgi:hypothetical protein
MNGFIEAKYKPKVRGNKLRKQTVIFLSSYSKKFGTKKFSYKRSDVIFIISELFQLVPSIGYSAKEHDKHKNV